jgi:tricorn protease
VSDDRAYLRFPSIHGDRVSFVAEDDVWLAPLDGGRAWRITADAAPVSWTRLSPDGTRIAFASCRDGLPEVTVVDVDGGPSRRLTYWGDEMTRVLGWTGDGRVLASSAVGEPFRNHTWGYAVPVDGGVAERLPYGPITGLAAGPDGATVLGVDQSRRGAASWKRYRGGQAGALWIDRDGGGEFVRLLPDLCGQMEDPAWIGDRVALLSDHEGWGNVYSCRPDGSDLRRHSDHGDVYARAASGDGARLVYQCRGDVWLVEDLAAGAEPRRLEIRLGGPRSARVPRPIDAGEKVGDLAPDRTGRGSAVEVRGTVHWLPHRDGPSRALADTPGVRARLPRVIGGGPEADGRSEGRAEGTHGDDTTRAQPQPVQVAWVTDAEGDDALEVIRLDSGERRRLAAGDLGRVLELVAAPDGSALAVATHDGRVLVVDVGSGAVRRIDASTHGDSTGLAFSPDSRWLAWSHAGPLPLRQIRIARLDLADAEGGGSPQVLEASRLRFIDTEPVFTPDGRHLAFLSARTFNPVYDEHVFDMAFSTAIRPHLLPLAAETPSPLEPELEGREVPAAEGGAAPSAPPEVRVDVDVEGLDQRAVPLPVPPGRYTDLQATRDGLIWLDRPLTGVLGHDQPGPERAPRPALRLYLLNQRRLVTLADEVDAVRVTGDGRRLVLRDRDEVFVQPADRRIEGERERQEQGQEARITVDLGRLRVVEDPAAQWRQMFEESGRLMRDHFWIPDFAGVDWEGVLAAYRPLLDRVGSRDDLSEVIWEVIGELGASHAYEMPPALPAQAARRLGHLGADLAPDDGGWRIERIVPGEPSAPPARSPLLAPGVAVRPGDVVVSVDGRPVDPVTGPGPLLVGAAGIPVALGVRPAGEAALRTVVVRPLPDERPLRYYAWVADRRAAVHAASGGRVGYLHLPDMMAEGWAQLHRDLHLEVARDAMIVDVRNNRGGHVSELVLEKLARAVRGWAIVRHASPEVYPSNAVRGPLVAVTNQWAGSDGDIVTAMFQRMGLGPVVGVRTWGGVIGIDMRYRLVDGTFVTQPRYSFWFDGPGWGVENYGVDPDIEVPFPPQAWAAGEDPQLDAAVQLALARLETTPPIPPPDPKTRPSRTPPHLPPRSPVSDETVS